MITKTAAKKKRKAASSDLGKRKHPSQDSSCKKRTKVNDVPDDDDNPPFTAPFPMLSRRWYGDQAEKARDDDGVPKTSTHVLPFPNISKEWYSRIKKSSVNEAENCADQRVNIVPFVALSKSWCQK